MKMTFLFKSDPAKKDSPEIPFEIDVPLSAKEIEAMCLAPDTDIADKAGERIKAALKTKIDEFRKKQEEAKP